MSGMTWTEKAAEHQRRMDEIGDVDDPVYQMHERRRDTCYANAADSQEQS